MSQLIPDHSESCDVNAFLLPALRQYQHNDCGGFVAAYDYEETQKIVLELMNEFVKVIKLIEKSIRDDKSLIEQISKIGN